MSWPLKLRAMSFAVTMGVTITGIRDGLRCRSLSRSGFSTSRAHGRFSKSFVSRRRDHFALDFDLFASCVRPILSAAIDQARKAL